MPDDTIAVLAIILILLLLLWLYIFLPASMAKKRGRSRIGWILLFWIISPLWGIILLLILGDSSEKIRDDIINGLRRK